MIEDKVRGLQWDVRPNREVEGAVDIVCRLAGVVSPARQSFWKLECVPIDILEELAAKARETQA